MNGNSSVGILESVTYKIENLSNEIMALKDAIIQLQNLVTTNQYWFDLKQACAIKGINYNTISSRPKLQPKGGKPDAIIAGRRRWKRESIMKWVLITDQD